jgi:hypothetical protein
MIRRGGVNVSPSGHGALNQLGQRRRISGSLLLSAGDHPACVASPANPDLNGRT